MDSNAAGTINCVNISSNVPFNRAVSTNGGLSSTYFYVRAPIAGPQPFFRGLHLFPLFMLCLRVRLLNVIMLLNGPPLAAHFLYP